MKILVDLTSSQAQGDMKINGGGESAIVFFKGIVENKSEKDIIEILLNERFQDKEEVIEWCIYHNINIIKYADLQHMNEIINNGNYNSVVFPVCYHRYCELKIDDSVRIISIIHDLCDIYYYAKPFIKYGRYPRLLRLEWLGKVYDTLISNQKTQKFIYNHNKVLHINNNQIIITVTHFTKASFMKYLNLEDVQNISVVYTPDVRINTLLNADDEINVLNKYNLEHDKYFLLMAGSRWAKNNAIVLFTLDKMHVVTKLLTIHLITSFNIFVYNILILTSPLA